MEKTTNPDFRLELLRQLTLAVTRKDVPGGLRLVESARKMMTDSNDSVAGQFRRLEAHLWYFSGDYQKSLGLSRMAASLLAPFGETVELAYAYYVAGLSLVSMGNYREAETAFLDAVSLFRRCDEPAGRVDAINQLARICSIRGEFRNALKYLLDAVKAAGQLSDREKLAYIWGNIGRIHTFLGNFKKATESLAMNIELSGELGDDVEKAKALLSLGYVEMLSEDYEAADRHFDEAYPLLMVNDQKRLMVMYQTYRGELQTRRGDYYAARRLLNQAVDGARVLGSESSLMVAPLRHLAALELACGKLTAAGQLAHQALALAERIDERVEKGTILRILAQIAVAEKNDEKKAAMLLARALEAFEEVDARFERAETLVLSVSLMTETPRRRLATLFRAAELYQRLEITSKYEKTQALINQSESLAAPANPHGPSLSAKDDQTTIVTCNRQMMKVMQGITQAAQSDLPVLLIGDTGTGKDLLARYYHKQSRREGEFVAVNCAAFPDSLLESELFGYRKGAFTGAGCDKEGLIQRAQGGTFFLDEIGEMPLTSQAKLLTVIETCRTRRLGDTNEETLDIRFVAATNCDLTDMVARGSFRRDLYFRLTGIIFTIPPLAERPEDIPVLLAHFLRREGAMDENESVDPSLIMEFSSRAWPGNVRQLESEVKKLVLFSAIAKEDSLSDLAGVLVQDERDSGTTSLFDQVEQFEKALILQALRMAEWNKSKAARALAIHESTLRAKMKRYDLDCATPS
ncbi:MAG: sigma 54-interacting transcriptional regulator [candidate division Zixibacteria bacterium]|nr:sigma 54-interacting transcriptional regulator [candidate division Zixibacteria bacterium]